MIVPHVVATGELDKRIQKEEWVKPQDLTLRADAAACGCHTAASETSEVGSRAQTTP